MIFIGIGANLPSPSYGGPRATCGAALASLEDAELSIDARSRWYKSAPQPISDQPWFVNAVIRANTPLDPAALMSLLLKTEKTFGRLRAEKNAPRVLDLDLLAYGEMVLDGGDDGAGALHVPHPRLHERAFVLLPLRDVAPGWRHPASGDSVEDMIGALMTPRAASQQTEVMADGRGKYGTEWQKNL